MRRQPTGRQPRSPGRQPKTSALGATRAAALLAVTALLVGAIAIAVPAESVDPLVTDGLTQTYRPGRLVDGQRTASTPLGTPAGPALQLEALRTGFPALEPTIGLTPEGDVFMTAADTSTITARLTRPRLIRSQDGGRTWQDVSSTVPVPAEQDGTTSIPPVTFDPYVHVDPDTGRVFQPELGPLTCSVMNISDDAGETWITNPVACGVPFNDHQTITTGPPPLGVELPVYPNVLYYCFSQMQASSCGRSLDGGLTFTITGEPAFDFDSEIGGLCDGIHGHVTVDGEGRLLMPKGHCGRPWLAISEDAGTTWGRTLVSPDIAADDPHTAVAVDAAGNIFYVWWDRTDRLPWMAVSTDHGVTWGEPLMIAPPGVAEVNFPVVEAGDEGRVAVMFPGTTVDDPDDDRRPWNSYHLISTDILSDDPTFVSATANPVDDPIHRGDCGRTDLARCSAMLDFLDIALGPDGTVWTAIVDTCVGNCIPNHAARDGWEGVAVRQVDGPRLREAAADG